MPPTTIEAALTTYEVEIFLHLMRLVMNNGTAAVSCEPMPKALPEKANLIVRSSLMSAISGRVESWNVTQETAACRLGIDRPRLNNLLRGKIAKFSLDALLNIAIQSGVSVTFEIEKSVCHRFEEL